MILFIAMLLIYSLVMSEGIFIVAHAVENSFAGRMLWKRLAVGLSLCILSVAATIATCFYVTSSVSGD